MIAIFSLQDQVIHLRYMNLLQTWQFWASIPGIAGLWALIFKVMLPGIRKWFIKGLAAEGAYFIETVTGLMMDRRHAPMVRNMIDKMYRDRIRIQDSRWEEVTKRLGQMERESSMALQNIGSLTLSVEGHNETMDMLLQFMPEHRTLLETQIRQTGMLNETLEKLRTDISAHTSQIGELRGVLNTISKDQR